MVKIKEIFFFLWLHFPRNPSTLMYLKQPKFTGRINMIAQSVVNLSHVAMCFVYIVCLGETLCKFVTSISGLVLLEIKSSHYQHAVLCLVMTIHAVFLCFNHVLMNRMASLYICLTQTLPSGVHSVFPPHCSSYGMKRQCFYVFIINRILHHNRFNAKKKKK